MTITLLAVLISVNSMAQRIKPKVIPRPVGPHVTLPLDFTLVCPPDAINIGIGCNANSMGVVKCYVNSGSLLPAKSPWATDSLNTSNMPNQFLNNVTFALGVPYAAAQGTASVAYCPYKYTYQSGSVTYNAIQAFNKPANTTCKPVGRTIVCK